MPSPVRTQSQRLVSLVLCAVAVASPLTAQRATSSTTTRATGISPSSAAALAFRDTLSGIGSAAGLAPYVEANRADMRATGNDGGAQIRQGLILLRQAELDPGRAALDNALAAFDEATFRNGRSAVAWYGLALTKLEYGRRELAVKASMHQADGETWRHGALAALAKSIGADSTFTPAAATMADLLVSAAEQDLEPAVQRAVRSAVAAGSGTEPILAFARLQRALGHQDSALAALHAYARAGGDPGIAGLESARSLAATGLPDSSVRTYLAGAARPGPAGRLLYRADIGWVATPAEMAAFDSLPPDATGRFVQEFWQRRDVVALRPDGARLAEHLRRWVYVHDHFRIVGRTDGAQFTDGPGATGPGADPALVGTSDVGNDLGSAGILSPDAFSLIEGGRRVLDDRGIVYMRHGEPDGRASWGALGAAADTHGCVVANESWQYALPTGTLLLHFCSSRRLGTTAATTLVAALPLYEGMIESRGTLDSRYTQLANALGQLAQRQKLDARGAAQNRIAAGMGEGPASTSTDLGFLVSPQMVQAIRERGQRQLSTALHTDTYVQRYESSLKPVVQLYAVGTPASDNARLLVIFAIPGERLTPEIRPGVSGVIYPIAIRTIAAGPTGLHVMRRDTTRYFRVPEALKAGAYLNGMLELPMPPGQSDVRVLFTQPGTKAAAAAGRDAMTVGTPGALAVSDLVTGRQGSGLAWAHGGDPVALNPLDVYARSSTLELYYDVSGLLPGHAYRTSIELTNTGGVAGDQVRVAFEDKPATTVLHVRRSIELKALKGGEYRMLVTVEDAAGGSKVVRERTVNVRE